MVSSICVCGAPPPPPPVPVTSLPFVPLPEPLRRFDGPFRSLLLLLTRVPSSDATRTASSSPVPASDGTLAIVVGGREKAASGRGPDLPPVRTGICPLRRIVMTSPANGNRQASPSACAVSAMRRDVFPGRAFFFPFFVGAHEHRGRQHAIIGCVLFIWCRNEASMACC